ncbi:MAG: adenylosuccinate synthetase, partial [Planctomycetota bacterium]|nr:adenylosuccinate synthetase [Planctomycetota bacterium]
TTTANALSILEEIEFQGEIERLGLLRAYHTRHGAGPFPSVNTEMSNAVKDLHNGTGPWQGEFRVGHFDLVLARYALAVCDVDSLVITNIDRLEGRDKKAVVAYSDQTTIIDSLPVKSELEDLDHQEELTTLLQNLRLILRDLPTDSDAYIEALSQLLEKPVSIVSRGPSARDKVRRELCKASSS